MASNLKAAVVRFCRINTDDAILSAFVDDAINIALYEVARESPWPELLVIGTAITLANATGSYNLPLNFMIMERVRYTSTGRTWRLSPRTGLVPPPPIFGKPRAFVLNAGPTVANPYKINIEPSAGVLATETMTIDYMKVPTLYDGTTGTLSNLWDAEIQNKAIHYVMLYQERLDTAKALWATHLNQMKGNSNDSSGT